MRQPSDGPELAILRLGHFLGAHDESLAIRLTDGSVDEAAEGIEVTVKYV